MSKTEFRQLVQRSADRVKKGQAFDIHKPEPPKEYPPHYVSYEVCGGPETLVRLSFQIRVF